MNIEISALGPTISEQVERLGLTQTGKSLETIDRISHGITMAHIHGCLTDAEVDRARNRLMKMLKLAKAA